jgi:preprotein translocase subunit SecG
MYVFLIFIHLLICVALVGVVLMQSGKGGGLAGGAFGGSAQTVFGGRGATDFLSKATMVLGGLFFAMSLVLALISSHSSSQTKSLMGEQARKAAASAPAQQQGAAPGAGAQAPATPAGGAPAPAAPAGGR